MKHYQFKVAKKLTSSKLINKNFVPQFFCWQNALTFQTANSFPFFCSKTPFFEKWKNSNPPISFTWITTK